MNVSVKTLGKRFSEVQAALAKNEKVVLSHEGKDVALLQPVFDVEAEIERISKLPAVGMWDDREDMKDPSEWVRKQRRSRHERLFGAPSGDTE